MYNSSSDNGDHYIAFLSAGLNPIHHQSNDAYPTCLSSSSLPIDGGFKSPLTSSSPSSSLLASKQVKWHQRSTRLIIFLLSLSFVGSLLIFLLSSSPSPSSLYTSFSNPLDTPIHLYSSSFSSPLKSSSSSPALESVKEALEGGAASLPMFPNHSEVQKKDQQLQKKDQPKSSNNIGDSPAENSSKDSKESDKGDGFIFKREDISQDLDDGTYEDLVEEFDSYIKQHDKVYSSAEEKSQRLGIYIRNKRHISKHNAQRFSYTLAVNAFTDMTFDEFKSHHHLSSSGYRPSPHQRHSNNNGLLGVNRHIDWSLAAVKEGDIPLSVDWREKGCVTAVKDQKKCGSCWAFSASGSVEGNYCARHGSLLNLSEQQMVDCGGPEGNEGCDGGEMDDAFQYIIDEGGLCKESDYPYTGKEGRCKAKRCMKVAKVSGFSDVPKENELALKAALALHGPVAVAIEADEISFQFYHKGVYDSPCGSKLNHGVLAVGYGTDEESGKDYWIVKNSWGRTWGDGGYIKLGRKVGNKEGECGVLMEGSFPIIE